MAWFAKNKYALLAVVAIGVFLIVLALIGDDESVEGLSPSTTQSSDPSRAIDWGQVPGDLLSSANRPAVEPVDCRILLTADEVKAALGRESGLTQEAEGETCTHALIEDPGFFVTIEPALPTNMQSGEAVSGVGLEATWVGRRGIGTLNVVDEVPFGFAIFRITVARPDADDGGLLEEARGLALAALPRLQAHGQREPEPEAELEVITFEPEPVDLPHFGYVDHLIAKEEAGDWTRGEGLVAILQLLAGEVEATEVLTDEGLINDWATDVIHAASSYQESGSDPDARAEIARLLQLLAPSREQLMQMSDQGESSSVGSLLVFAGQILPEAGNYCLNFHNASKCLRLQTHPELEEAWPGKYQLFRPGAEFDSGWELHHIDSALEAMVTSASKLEPLGTMPRVNVVFSVLAKGYTFFNLFNTGECTHFIPERFQTLEESQFKQALAALLANCLLRGTFNTVDSWWYYGMSIYLSDFVYPLVDHEWDEFPMWTDDVAPLNWLQAHDPDTSLLERTVANWALFECVHGDLGAKGVLGIVPGLPTSLNPYLHEFYEDLTDGTFHDVAGPTPCGGGGFVGLWPDAASVFISAPLEATLVPPIYGGMRLHATVTPGKFACLATFQRGDLEVSWRKGAPGGAGVWTDEPPLTITGESVFLVTATGPDASYLIVVEEVGDTEECEEEEESSKPGASVGPFDCDLCRLTRMFLACLQEISRPECGLVDD